jgi:hypothetical protein
MHGKTRIESSYIRDAAWQLTANGLARRDKHLLIFLLYRAVLLDYVLFQPRSLSARLERSLEARLSACLAAAWWQSEISGNPADRERIKLMIERLNEDSDDVRNAARKITAAKLEAIVELESQTCNEDELYRDANAEVKNKKTAPAEKKKSGKGKVKNKIAEKEPEKEPEDDDNFGQLELF